MIPHDTSWYLMIPWIWGECPCQSRCLLQESEPAGNLGGSRNLQTPSSPRPTRSPPARHPEVEQQLDDFWIYDDVVSRPTRWSLFLLIEYYISLRNIVQQCVDDDDGNSEENCPTPSRPVWHPDVEQCLWGSDFSINDGSILRIIHHSLPASSIFHSWLLHIHAENADADIFYLSRLPLLRCLDVDETIEITSV